MKGKYLLPQEAAEYLGISLSTLYRVEQRGAIRPIRTPGGHRRYAVDMLDGYLVAAASFKPRRRAVVAKTEVAKAAVSVASVATEATIEAPVVEEPAVEPVMATVEAETEQTWATEQAAPSPVSAHAIDLSAEQPAPLFKPSAHVLDLRGGQA